MKNKEYLKNKELLFKLGSLKDRTGQGISDRCVLNMGRIADVMCYRNRGVAKKIAWDNFSNLITHHFSIILRQISDDVIFCISCKIWLGLSYDV
jgi:hypothetical protein